MEDKFFDLVVLSVILLLLVLMLKKCKMLDFLIGISLSLVALIAGSLVIDAMLYFNLLIAKYFFYIISYLLVFGVLLYFSRITIYPLTIVISVWFSLEWTAFYTLGHPVNISLILSSKSWIVFSSSFFLSWIILVYKSNKLDS